MNTNPSKQAGSVLIICIVVLLALTSIGLAGMRNSVMQERIVGGARDQSVAFQAAEAALRKGEEQAMDIIEKISEYAELKPTDAVSCQITSNDWVAPADLKKDPASPTCLIESYYAGLVASREANEVLIDIPEICIKTGEAPGPNGYSECQQDSPRGLLFTVTAEGHGSTGSSVSLRSTYMIVKDIE